MLLCRLRHLEGKNCFGCCLLDKKLYQRAIDRISLHGHHGANSPYIVSIARSAISLSERANPRRPIACAAETVGIKFDCWISAASECRAHMIAVHIPRSAALHAITAA